MRERQLKGLRYLVGLCSLLLWLQMACGGGSAECTNDIQVSEYNTSGLKCTQPCDCSNLKYEGYCISGTCISTTRSPAQRKGDIRPCKLLQKVGACEWGQQRAQPDPLKELVWGDCKAEEVGPNFAENTKARCLDGLDNDCDGLADFGDTKCSTFCTPKQISPCYTAETKTVNLGPCRSGLKTCQDDSTWGPCVGEKIPKKEICNKEDDDCNGLIDDNVPNCPAQPCQDGQQRACYSDPVGCSAETDAQGIVRFRCQGICRAGFQTCQKGVWGACDGMTIPAASESCDGIDNNCNGSVDEGCLCEDGKEQECSLGAEKKPVGECPLGKQKCVDRKWGICDGAKAPNFERCDGLDNDCNGASDDRCACAKDADCPKDLFCVDGFCRKSDCPSGQARCSGSCVDTKTSDAHCGSCENACTVGKTCKEGACKCPSGQDDCGSGCIALSSETHCGSCGNACAGEKTCQEGACKCTSEKTECGGTCVDTLSSGTHCGGCGKPCATQEVCSNGKCALNCPSEQVVCAGGCVNTKENKGHCGGCGQACTGGKICSNSTCQCPQGETFCADSCVNTTSNKDHCGGCGQICGSPRSCTGGSCVCPQGTAFCENTCVDTKTSADHCGSCSSPCKQPRSCTGGSCVCPNSESFCTDGCVNTTNNKDHCGSCGNACTGGKICNNSTCQCPQGTAFCTNSCVDTQTSAAHCGACSSPCDPPRLCTGGSCACSGTLSFCNGECVDASSSNQHCGSCGNACAGTKTCASGRCVCSTGQDDCGNGCIELTSDAHCGACNNACSGGKTCQNKQCACPVGKTDCNGVCTDMQLSMAHCGSCGNACTGWTVCHAGQCKMPTILAAGSNHACAVTDCNTLTCWGANDKGQLGIAMSCPSCAPTAVPLPSGLDVVQVAAGDSHTCAVFSDGSLRCWGINTFGQLGYGDTASRNTPDAAAISLGTGRSAKFVATGSFHTCAILDDGSVKCWGNDGYGQLGYGNQRQRNAPETLPINLGTARSATSIAAGERHTCALLDDGNVKCWGTNANGQLGDSSVTSRTAPPTAPINLGTGRTAKSITTGAHHTCAILDNNTLKCWGINTYGQLGDNSITMRDLPPPTPINLGAGHTAKSVTSGKNHTCAILDDDSIKCWGSDEKYQLGYGDNADRKVPDTNSISLGTGRSARFVVAGETFTCAFLDDGTLRCWGNNDKFQSEYSSPPTRPLPASYPLTMGQIRCTNNCVSALETSRCGACQTTCQTTQVCAVGRCAPKPLQVAAGFSYSCVLFADGLRCWGVNDNGQLGNGDVTSRLTAQTSPINLGAGRSAKSFAMGEKHTCALLDDNTVKCWGWNGYGQLGYGDTTQRDTPPTNPINLGTNRSAKSIAANYWYTCAILDDDSLKCWGNSGSGQLGYGDLTARYAPDANALNLGIGRTAKWIAPGYYHTCLILDDNSARCWGSSSDGQLGYGSTTPYSAPPTSPINLGASRSAKSIAVGERHTCAILDDNTVKCWGRNNNGQLGYDDTTQRSAPPGNAVNLGVGYSAKAIATGLSHTCVILNNDTVKCWGYNNVGQLGYGDTNQRNKPTGNIVDLGAGRTAKSISAHENHTCVLLDDDSIKCWGTNNYSQLGYGDITQRNAPTSPLPLP